MNQLLNHVVVLQDLQNDILKFIEKSQEEYAKSGYKKIVEENEGKKEASPFLSIIVRTQGRREQSLREVFLCLEGQENQDFEVVLIGHKLNDDQNALIHLILDQQSENMRKKTRFIPLNSGNRTTPLNVGFANAWGKYIVTLDDDDIVLDNWVGNFYDAATKHEGKVLYNYALAQNWSVVEKGEYANALRAESAFDTEFARDYNDVLQVELNRCPPVGLAYPAVAFQKLGIIFDENLATTEDWDYLMRAAYVCGVHSIAEPSCIYRKWINAENSCTVHQQEEWHKNYEIIVEKISQKMLCLPKGSSATIFQLIKDREWLLSGKATAESKSCVLDYERLYIGDSGQYSEQRVILSNQRQVNQNGEFENLYLVEGKYKDSAQFRWDPIEKGIIVLKDISITIIYEDESSCVIKQNEIRHNGKDVEDYILFAQDDPQILFETHKTAKIYKIIIKGVVFENIPLSVFEGAMQKEKGLFNRFFRKF